MPKFALRYRVSGLWGPIASVGDESNVSGKVFKEGVGFKVGDGRDIRFWHDDWVGVGPLYNSFPRVFRAMSNKNCQLVSVKVIWEDSVCWEVSFRRGLR